MAKVYPNPVDAMTSKMSISEAADQVIAIFPISGLDTAAVGADGTIATYQLAINPEVNRIDDNGGAMLATDPTPDSPHLVRYVTDLAATNADAAGATFRTTELTGDQSSTGTFTDLISHDVAANVAGDEPWSSDLSAPTDGAVATRPVAGDSAEQAMTTVVNGAPTTAGALTPGLSVNAANPSNVIYSIFGMQSDEHGTVTFTDSSGQQDVVNVGSNGTYTANLSNLTNGALTYLMTVTDARGHVINVDPTAMLGDGSANAPAGSPELPTLLNGYVVRPSWYVAGVDYAVGVAAGTSLLDPATISMAGVSVNTSTRSITVYGNNVTLSGYDFSLHGGYYVYITGANDTIKSSNFALGANTTSYLIDGAPTSSNMTIEDCTMDASTIGNLTSFIGFSGSGSLTLEYNWLKNFPQHILELAQAPGVDFSVVYKYNLIEQGAIAAGAHLNYLQFASGNATSVDVEFNTTYQTRQASSGEGYQFVDNAPGGTINNATLAYNTMIATGGSSGSPAMSYLVHGNSPTFNGTVDNNYVDASSAYGTFYGGSFTGASIYNNVDMNTGSVVNVDNSETAAVTNVVSSPSTGIERPGTNITLTVDFSKAVSVSGIPTLTFNDGGTATYTGGSGTKALTFTYTVSSSDSTVSALAITGVNLPNGAMILDGTANVNLAGALVTFSGLGIDPPTNPTVTAVTESPSTGDLNAGHTITLTLGLNEAVTVAGGTPTLTLNDGGVATYTGGSGTGALTFSYTVAAGQNAASLAATAVNLNGATIHDGAGNAASLSLSGLTQAGPQIDTLTPAATSIVELPASGDLNAGHTITLTLGLNEAVTVAGGTPTLTLNDGGVATYTGGSGTGALTFSYTVAVGQNAASLAATAVNLNGATIHDGAGNAASLSLSGLTQAGPQIDTIAPNAPVITSDSISGSNVTLVGSAEANAMINVYDGGAALVGAVEANSSGAWTLTTGPLSNGAHAFTATATDGAGNTSVASQAVDPVIGGAPPNAPTINSASPNASGDPVANANVFTLHGTAQANSTVHVFDGTASLGTASVGANGDWAFVTNQLATGVHQFSAVDVANGGTSSASTVLNATAGDPTVTLT